MSIEAFEAVFEDDNRDLQVEDMLFDIGSEDFISNEISNQIEFIFNKNKRNYLATYLAKYKYLAKNYDNDPDTLRDLKENKDIFISEIIQKISSTFSIGIDEEEISKKMAKTLYSFFIIDYVENLEQMFLNIIQKHKKTIIQELKNLKLKRDVGAIANRAKYSNANDAILINNIKRVLFDIIPNLGISENFISYIVDYDNTITNQNITKLIDKGAITISSDTFEDFIEPFIDKCDGYSIICSDIILELAKTIKQNDIDILNKN